MSLNKILKKSLFNGVIVMNENELWQRFCENGRVSDYLEYKNTVNAAKNSELESLGENNSTGIGDKRTECR